MNAALPAARRLRLVDRRGLQRVAAANFTWTHPSIAARYQRCRNTTERGCDFLLSPGACLLLSSFVWCSTTPERTEAQWWWPFRESTKKSPFNDPRLHKAHVQRHRAGAKLKAYVDNMRAVAQELIESVANGKVSCVAPLPSTAR